MKRSSHLFPFSPAMVPRIRDNMIDMTTEDISSINDKGVACSITFRTVSLLKYDSPRSPWNRFTMYILNCSGMDFSSPILSLIACCCSTVAVGAMTFAGSPGIIRSITKLINITQKVTKMPCASLFKTVPSTLISSLLKKGHMLYPYTCSPFL